MITIEQCRAARGLLGWTQGDLADATGISKTSVNNFERGLADTKRETLESMKHAFERNGVQFYRSYGVNKVEETCEIVSGAKSLDRLWNDIAVTMAGLKPDENDSADIRILASVDEALMLRQNFYGEETLKKIAASGFKVRILSTKEGHPDNLSFAEHKEMPQVDSHTIIPTISYANKVILRLWHSDTVLFIRSKKAFDAERDYFNYLWENQAPDLPYQPSSPFDEVNV